MTVIVGILNAKGCVLASDSAQSTTLNNKITGIVPTSKKIFELENQKIALGIYGNSNYFSIPLQNIIGTFSKLNSQNEFTTVKACKDGFMNYIATLEAEKDYMFFIGNMVNSNITYQFNEDSKSHTNILDIINNIYSLIATNLSAHPATTEYLNRYETYLDEINKSVEDYFKSKLATYQMSEPEKTLVNNWVHEYHQQKEVLNSSIANNVILIGFGSKELLPSISVVSFSGKYFDDLQTEVIYEDTILGSWSSIIQPLADSSEIYSYINGIHPTLLKELTEAGHLNNDRIRREYSTPFLNAIAGVNLQELGELGKSLVTITSLKKRFSDSDESVGGPVQLISVDLINGCKHEIF